MLDIGQERSKEKAALTAEPHCGPDLTYPRTPRHRASLTEFRVRATTPKGQPFSSESGRSVQRTPYTAERERVGVNVPRLKWTCGARISQDMG